MKILSVEQITEYRVCHDDYDDRYYRIQVNERGELVDVIWDSTEESVKDYHMIIEDFRKALGENAPPLSRLWQL